MHSERSSFNVFKYSVLMDAERPGNSGRVERSHQIQQVRDFSISSHSFSDCVKTYVRPLRISVRIIPPNQTHFIRIA